MADKKIVEVRKSAVKTHRQSEEARIRHKSRRNAISTMEKKLRAAVAAGDKDLAFELLKAQYSVLDKAVKSGTFHKNKADRKKSRLGALVAKTAAPKAEA